MSNNIILEAGVYYVHVFRLLYSVLVIQHYWSNGPCMHTPLRPNNCVCENAFVGSSVRKPGGSLFNGFKSRTKHVRGWGS